MDILNLLSLPFKLIWSIVTLPFNIAGFVIHWTWTLVIFPVNLVWNIGKTLLGTAISVILFFTNPFGVPSQQYPVEPLSTLSVSAPLSQVKSPSTITNYQLSNAVSEDETVFSQKFQSDQQAQQHCPDDTVVWVNLKTRVYHRRGQRWYGNTNQGAYECMKGANSEGDRPSMNGQ